MEKNFFFLNKTRFCISTHANAYNLKNGDMMIVHIIWPYFYFCRNDRNKRNKNPTKIKRMTDLPKETPFATDNENFTLLLVCDASIKLKPKVFYESVMTKLDKRFGVV